MIVVEQRNATFPKFWPQLIEDVYKRQLLDHDVTFPYCVGVSAGISDGVSYLSKQRGRNLEIVRRFRNDPRYIGVRNFFTCKSLFGLDFVFREIPQKWIPFDYETFRSYEGTCLVGVTNARTGKTEYFHGQEDGCLLYTSIRRRTPPELELEVFVHGAMCMSVSGRCLL